MDVPVDYHCEASVLFVSDDHAAQQLVSRIVKRNFPRVTLHLAENGQHGLEIYKRLRPDITLTETALPVMNGTRMARAIRSLNSSAQLVLVTAERDAHAILESIEMGITHFLLKPVNAEKLVGKLEQCLKSVTLEKKLRSQYDYIRNNAYYDAMTELPNRHLFFVLLRKAISQAQRNNRQLALLFVDIDNLASVNDALGHIVGDQVLKAAAARLLQSCRRSPDTVARWGGDEFVILLTDVATVKDAVKLANKMIDSFEHPLLPDQEIFIDISIGISMFPDDGTDEDALINRAEMAMRRKKKSKTSQWVVGNRSVNDRCVRLMEMECDLRRAQINGEFFLDYQPAVNIDTGELVGLEALLRWQHPKLGLIPPEQFIGVAEDTGLIEMLGEWVLRTACSQNKAWQNALYPPVRISVNVSTNQIRSLKLTETVREILADTELDPCWLELEISEDILSHHHNTTVNTLKNLHDLGIRICIDNFGTGTTSLGSMRRFPVDAVKIDRSFVSRITASSDDAAIASTIIAIARNLELGVTAEGVEDEDQLNYLRRLDCTDMQGYLFSKPLSADDCASFLSEAQSGWHRPSDGSPYNN